MCLYQLLSNLWQLFALILLWKISIHFSLHFFFTIHILKEIKKFGYIGSWLYRFRSDAEVVPFHWSPYHIPLEWPVWHCLIECNFHLYHGFLHVHFWTHLFFNESHYKWYLSAFISFLAFAINLIPTSSFQGICSMKLIN